MQDLFLEDGVDDEMNNGENIVDFYEKVQEIGSDATGEQALKILPGLGFTKSTEGIPTKSFSGGWHMRISLARALFFHSSLLLLDEPTNHMDLRVILWLE